MVFIFTKNIFIILKPNPEINALLQLIDDPDSVVHETVSKKLESYGSEILPNLQNQLLATESVETQTRIEFIINKIAFQEIKSEFYGWAKNDNLDLYNAVLLMCKYRNQSADDETEIRKKIKNIYQSTWLELNNYLSPIEQINVMSSIFYNMYRLESKPLETKLVDTFFVDQLVETKHGNGYSLGLLYLVLASMLSIPIFAVDIPDQFLLAYFETSYNFLNPDQKNTTSILFYIDPTNGMIYTQDDVNAYLKKINIESNSEMYVPLSPKQVMKTYIKTLITCYKNTQLINYKEKELLQLLEILTD
jgi:regulator of sirC expression with transglutaminase-like and TPR domain